MDDANDLFAVLRQPGVACTAQNSRSSALAAMVRCMICTSAWLASALLASVPMHASAAEDSFERGLLWEISRPGVAPSYLYGTMHLGDPRLLALPPAADRAFGEARTYVLEMYPDPAVARRFSEAGELEGGRRLSALLPEASFERLAGRLAARGLTRDQLDRLKPWAALLLVTAAEGGSGESLDIALYARARFENKRIEELDSVEEQIAVFDSIAESTQLALIDIALERHDALRSELEENILAYLRGDLAALARLSRRNGGNSEEGRAHQAELEKKIVHDRSVVMAYRLQPHLRRGRCFAAVGALHLYGPKGMLALLAEDGWLIRALR